MGIYDRIETDNPLLDELVYNFKMMVSTVILKDEETADKNETVDSLRRFNIYDACISGRAKYEYFTIELSDFLSLGYGESIAKEFLEDSSKVPYNVKNQITLTKSNEFMKECQNTDGKYVDTNVYYRWLGGYPSIEEDGIFLTKVQRDVLALYVSDNLTVAIHDFSYSVRLAVESTGLLKDLKDANPGATYLQNYTKNIDIYSARKSVKYGMIYMKSTGIEPILYQRYCELLDKNRVYIQKIADKKAFSIFSDYYGRFMMMMIVFQAGIDFISELPEYYIKKDLFDIRTIEYFLESNGVVFFSEIPLKYQKRLVKNLNKLCKYKGTYVNIVDITSLFGFENIEIFKYYLVKERSILSDGSYSNTGNIDQDYELKFLKVEMNDNVDIAARDRSNFLDYDSITSVDKYWDGPYAHDYIKHKILEQEFNLVKSKYISIDTVYAINDMSFELTYFNNMLMYTGVDKSKLNLIVPFLSNTEKYNLLDLFCFLYSLMYLYNNVEDEIIIDPNFYLAVKGFNLEADLAELSTYVISKGYTLKDFGVDKYMAVPQTGFISISQMISIFINNKDIYDFVTNQMKETDSKKIYDIYKKIYDSLFITSLNISQYYIDELGRTATTYKEYLYYSSRDLYNIIESYELIQDEKERSTTVYGMVNKLTDFIIGYINNDKITNIFSNLPVESNDYLKEYMYKMINFFKSYMLDVMDIRAIYKFEQHDYVKILESTSLSYYYIKKELFKVIEKMYMYATLPRDEAIEIIDNIILSSVFDINDNGLGEFYEKFVDFHVEMTKYEPVEVKESLNMLRNYIRNIHDSLLPHDEINQLTAGLSKSDIVVIRDDKFIERFYV